MHGRGNCKVPWKNSAYQVTIFVPEPWMFYSILLARHSNRRFSNKENPLKIFFISQLENVLSQVRIPSSFEIQPEEVGAIDLEVRLILPSERVSILTLSSDMLGDYLYELQLRAVQAGPETPMQFDVPLGNRHTQKFQFVHYLPAKVQYTCALSSDAVACGFLLEKPTVDANPADMDGLEVQVAITFEPWKIANDFSGMLTASNPTGGTYTVKLYGKCHPPIPQGPIIIKGAGGMVNFRNVFTDPVEYIFQVDNIAFTVGKGEKMPPKKPTKIKVAFKSVPGAAPNGKLMVSCPAYGPWIWIFYLQGV